MNFSLIKGVLLNAKETEAKKGEKVEKAIEEFLNLTCLLIQEHMSLDVKSKMIFADIPRKELTTSYWESFESNGLLLKTRLPGVLNERLGEGVQVVFNSLLYGKEADEDEYIFFEFAVELVD